MVYDAFKMSQGLADVVLVGKRSKKAQEALVKEGYMLIDVTSSNDDATFRKFSPFYPHGDIPVPGTLRLL